MGNPAPQTRCLGHGNGQHHWSSDTTIQQYERTEKETRSCANKGCRETWTIYAGPKRT